MPCSKGLQGTKFLSFAVYTKILSRLTEDDSTQIAMTYLKSESIRLGIIGDST